MNFKLIGTMPLALTLLLTGCEEPVTENQLSDELCTRVDAFNSLDSDGEVVADVDAVFLCGRDQAELDAKVANAQEEFDAAVAAAIEAFTATPDPIDILNFDSLTTEPSGFNGAVASIVDNPNLSGTNDVASQVLSIENTASAPFEGISTAPLEMDIDFSASSSKTILVDVFSDQEVVVDFQVKRNDGTSTLENPRGASLKQTHSGSGWETLTFNFNIGAVKSFDNFAGDGDPFVPEGLFNQVVILVDGGSPASLGAATYFVDNIKLAVLAPSEAPTLVESPLLNFDDLSVDFAGFNGAVSTIVSNPNLSGSNDVASQVLSIENTATANFEGAASDPLVSDIDFSASSSKTITLDVYSEESVVVDFQVKRNEGDVTLQNPRGASLTQTHTGSGWETLTFNFNEGANKSFDGFSDDGETPFVPEGLYNQFVILINPGTPAPLGAATYFVDNINILVSQ